MEDIPEHIKHHILSFLPCEESTKTCVLSKSWLSAWRRRPNLIFDYKIFFSKVKQEDFWTLDADVIIKRDKKFSRYIKRTLKRCSSAKVELNIDQFVLDIRTFGWRPVWDSIVKRCVQVAVERSVKTLFLSLDEEDPLPEILLEAKSLVNLSLRGGTLIDQQSIEKIKRFDFLKRLSLYMVSLDTVTFNHMMLSCQSVEILEITYCQLRHNFSEYFILPKLDNLKECTIKLESDDRVILHEAPNLESLIFQNNEDDMWNIDDWTPCWLDLCSSDQYKNLKTLVLRAVGRSDNVLDGMIHKFPHLEYLSIQACQDLDTIKITSHSLKRLELVDNWGLKGAKVDVPSMVHFEYCDSYCDVIPMLSFSKVPSAGHWTSCVSIGCYNVVNVRWFLKLKELLSSLFQSKISLNLEFHGNIAFDFAEIIKNMTFHEPQDVQELSLDIGEDLPVSSAIPLLEVCFRVCHPKILRNCWEPLVKNQALTKPLYEMLMFRRNQEEFHNFQRIKFWQNNLKGVKIEIFQASFFLVGHTRKYCAVGKGEQHPEGLDWENFLNVLKTRSMERTLTYFTLEWGAPDKPKGKKRGATDKPKEEKRLRQRWLDQI